MNNQIFFSKSFNSTPFWNSSTDEWSKKIWSCSDSNLELVDENRWSTSLKTLGGDSWFSVKVKTPVIDAKKKEFDNKINSGLAELIGIKKRKGHGEQQQRIKIYTDIESSNEKIQTWFHVIRWVYNQNVHFHNTSRSFNSLKHTDKLKALRSNLSKVIKSEGNEWFLDLNVPYKIYSEGIRWFLKSFAIEKVKCKGNGHNVKVPFMRKRNPSNFSIRLTPKTWSQEFCKFIVNDFKSDTGPLPSEVNVAMNISSGPFGVFLTPDIARSVQYAPESIVALDPGIRTFMTCFFANGNVVEWADKDVSHIIDLNNTAEMFEQRVANGEEHCRGPWLKTLMRIRTLVDEVHDKFATYLCENVRCILLPNFNLTGGDISNNYWGHERFRQVLKNKIKQYPHCVLYICDEHFTTKTCGSCGFIHNDIGKSKLFVCPKCNYTAGRDVNAARNVLLRFLTLEAFR